VEVFHPGSVRDGQVERAAVAAMVTRGISDLTGAPTAIDAWRSLFAPGDVVGLKVNPVGRPLAISSFALIHEVVAGLRQAGVRARDIVVFDRFRRQLRAAGYVRNLPPDVRWDGPSEDWDVAQIALAGYDPDVYCELPIAPTMAVAGDDRRSLRSHLCLLVSRHVNKVINLPVLKDHSLTGVTLALKNLSHGLVNNVSRSHWGGRNTCEEFTPAVCALPAIREKVVLHILDATHAIFEGGPQACALYTRAHRRLYFATDPVALDCVGRDAIDTERAAMDLPPVAGAHAHGYGEAAVPTSPLRQPQYIERAGALGLGVADRTGIDHRTVTLSER
jgi:hypothetical protein